MNLPNKKYSVIYADPPWQFQRTATGGKLQSSAEHNYPVMTIDDLKAMPVKDLADKNAILIMWWVGSMPQEAIDLTHAWGFKIRNMNGFVWNKKTVRGKRFFGMGTLTRAGSESAIIATRGVFKPELRNVRAVVSAKVGKHSEKPHVFRQRIVQLCGDKPRIELFARTKKSGWDVWGNEV
jgi:N6-adenosine-specific RNA methylase IME4